MTVGDSFTGYFGTALAYAEIDTETNEDLVPHSFCLPPPDCIVTDPGFASPEEQMSLVR